MVLEWRYESKMEEIRITVRFVKDALRIHKALTNTARNNRRSLNSEMLRAFEFYLKNASEAHYVVEPAEKEAKDEET